AQRITARFHLTPLDAAGTADYLRHRFRVAGGQHFPFDAGAVQRLHQRSGGIPRLVNVIAERALLAGYARDRATIDAALVEEAAREALPPAVGTPRRRGWALAAGAAALSVAVAALAAFWPGRAPVPAPAGDPVASPVDAARVHAAAPGADAPGDAVRPGGDAPGGTATAATAVDADALAARVAAASGPAAHAVAWQSLLAAWGLPDTPEDARAAAGCAPVLAPGTYCVRGSAHLDRITALGRPVLLQLESGAATAWARPLCRHLAFGRRSLAAPGTRRRGRGGRLAARPPRARGRGRRRCPRHPLRRRARRIGAPLPARARAGGGRRGGARNPVRAR